MCSWLRSLWVGLEIWRIRLSQLPTWSWSWLKKIILAPLQPPMYKKQVDRIFFPACTNILPRVFSIKNLIWPPDPLNKGKLNFLLHFWAKVPLFPPPHPCGNLPNIHGCLQHSEIWPFSLFKTQFQTIKIHEGHISENMAKLNKVRPLYFLKLLKFEKKNL